ncbi:carbon-nitrogen hydrolase family protein [Mucilaginibacter corticis]|uniref:Carbon-nitrogen hydrolase family protein n=1 Tax=Mucilaginibacter corticis TaxID=2597670 RepID=A0A556MWM4_9SPHI|nr:carbon-nitrogen hydrolase family protein [Mucilaginibacter corticis]TSJ44334.1 carbon-nitrogen hydrolase family protein [Mucilaginibacter corticis]
MKIAVASPPFPSSIADGLHRLEKLVKDAARQKAEIICFPESYIPGYPLEELTIEETSPEKLITALNKVCTIAVENNIAIILPMDWYGPNGKLNLAHVIDKTGKVLGYQTKNQLDPTEDAIWIPGTERSIFEVNGLKFGITICHEGFRYPESVRWAARNDAKVVFHPHCNGSNVDGAMLIGYRHKDNPYYEQAIMMRALENTIYFASSNYASQYPESASSIIAPDGTCIIHERYGQVGVIIADIDPELATGLLAKRFKPQLYANSL